MDVVKEKKKKSVLPIALACSAVFIILCIWLWLRPSASEAIEEEKLVLASVKQGDFDVTVSGFGDLRSKKQIMLTTKDSATVEEILLRPGAMLDAGSVIAKLSNPALLLQAEDAYFAWQQEISEARRLRLNNSREILASETTIADVDAEYTVIKQRLIAYEELVKNGVVSVLDHQAAQLGEAQHKKKLKIENKRLKQLQQLHQESLKTQQELIEQKHSQYKSVLKRVEALTVRSPAKGLLQRMPIELGQSLQAGEQLALIGSFDELVGLIKIAQREVTNIEAGQSALITLDGIKVNAEVVRVDPAVQDNGMMLVEVELLGAPELGGALPVAAKPERTVNATIIITSLKNVFYVKRPSVARQNARTFIYKKRDKSNLVRHMVEFGYASLNDIQIKNGVKAGDKIVLSDLSSFDGAQTIAIR